MTTKFPSQEELKEIREQLDQIPGARPLPNDANIVDKTKYKICRMFVIYKREQNITQVELARLIKADEAIVSKILRYHIDEFTTDRLIRYLSELYENVEVTVEVA